MMSFPKRILLVHNYYQQPGGEDVVFEAEKALLEANGHEVYVFTRHNDEIKNQSALKSAVQLLWSTDSYHQISDIIEKFRPDIAHFHNTYGVLSPSVYYACQKAYVPVVQTLHNYRLLCANALLYRQGEVCERCLGKTVPLDGIRFRCHRDSYLHSAAVTAMTTAHRWLGTWDRSIDQYIAVSPFIRDKYVEAGWPSEKISVNSNFLLTTTSIRDENEVKDYALFVGRLSAEKGIKTLLTAWKALDIPLRIVGDGPLRPEVEQASQNNQQINWLGRLDHEKVLEQIKQARFLIVPSECYETFGLTIVEAYSCQTPVIASKIGSLAELVRNQKGGLHVIPANSCDLQEKIEWAWSHPQEMRQMAEFARIQYQQNYQSHHHYQKLIEIYQSLCNVVR